jgi:hypothetical protein
MIKKKTLYLVYILAVVFFLGLQLLLISKTKHHTPEELFDFVSINESTPSAINFDISKDWLVFVHIQKTSGSDFDHKLLQNMLVFNKTEKRREFKWRKACIGISKFSIVDDKKRHVRTYMCPRNERSNKSWILSHSTEFGWHTCGLHADLHDLKSCVASVFQKPDGIFHFLTMLREPKSRFLSEWIHIKQTGYNQYL